MNIFKKLKEKLNSKGIFASLVDTFASLVDTFASLVDTHSMLEIPNFPSIPSIPSTSSLPPTYVPPPSASLSLNHTDNRTVDEILRETRDSVDAARMALNPPTLSQAIRNEWDYQREYRGYQDFQRLLAPPQPSPLIAPQTILKNDCAKLKAENSTLTKKITQMEKEICVLRNRLRGSSHGIKDLEIEDIV